MFVVTGLAIVGLPMLSGFVGEFLILSGSMQAAVAHHHFWTAIAATGVIFSAAYMLTMLQRVFYADLGAKPASIAPRDLGAREHLALWPLAILFLVMGLASPFWTRAIEPATSALTDSATPAAMPPASAVVTLSAQSAPGGAR
jgi:NADH-quinone oxidoreductase subunit M